MAAPTLTSISPTSGPPGTAITCVGTGFTSGSQVGCPAMVTTAFVDAQTLTATIPPDMTGTEGTSLAVGVWVRNADGASTRALTFVVTFAAVDAQAWTTMAGVCGEIPGFQRNGRIKDAQILVWIRSVAQSIAGVMLRRGLALDPAAWDQTPVAGGSAQPVDVLEMINRLGAAARLAAAIAGQLGSGEWGLGKNLERAFDREWKALQGGDYDKLFRPGAATVESAPLLSAGDMTQADGSSSSAFRKEKVF